MALSHRQLSARDRRLAAIHEAGHIVIASKYGLRLESAWICPADVADPVLERTWCGRTQIERLGRDPWVGRMVGVAGYVAEVCWQDYILQAEDLWEPECLSGTDWQMTCCQPGQPDDLCLDAFSAAGELMNRAGALWPALLREARKLIAESRGGKNFGDSGLYLHDHAREQVY